MKEGQFFCLSQSVQFSDSMSRTRIDQVIEVHARSAAILPADILTELIPAVQDLVLHRVRQPAACAYVPAGDVLIRLAVEIVAMFYLHKTHPSFLSFPCVCPEPVLVK